MKALLPVLIALSSASLPLAQQPVRPLPEVGGCPIGYYSSGKYCVSSPSNDCEAIQKRATPAQWVGSAQAVTASRTAEGSSGSISPS